MSLSSDIFINLIFNSAVRIVLPLGLTNKKNYKSYCQAINDWYTPPTNLYKRQQVVLDRLKNDILLNPYSIEPLLIKEPSSFGKSLILYYLSINHCMNGGNVVIYVHVKNISKWENQYNTHFRHMVCKPIKSRMLLCCDKYSVEKFARTQPQNKIILTTKLYHEVLSSSNLILIIDSDIDHDINRYRKLSNYARIIHVINSCENKSISQWLPVVNHEIIPYGLFKHDVLVNDIHKRINKGKICIATQSDIFIRGLLYDWEVYVSKCGYINPKKMSARSILVTSIDSIAISRNLDIFRTLYIMIPTYWMNTNDHRIVTNIVSSIQRISSEHQYIDIVWVPETYECEIFAMLYSIGMREFNLQNSLNLYDKLDVVRPIYKNLNNQELACIFADSYDPCYLKKTHEPYLSLAQLYSILFI